MSEPSGGSPIQTAMVVLLLAGLPWNLGLLVAGLSGMIVGAEIERRMTLRAERAAP